MTGAGTGELLLGREASFKGSIVDGDADGNADLFDAGRNPSITELDLGRQLSRLRDTQSAESVESIAQNVDGAVAIEAAVSLDTHTNIEEIVFNDGPGSGFTPGRANSASIFTECDFLSGTATRKLIGCIPLEYEVNYQQGETVTYSLRMGYADESRDVTIPTGDITRTSDDSTAIFHGFELAIDAATVSKLQSATLSISDIARFHSGTDPSPVDVVLATPTTTLDAEAIITDEDKLNLAYGSAGTTTSRQDTMDDVTATVTVDTGGGTNITTYELASVKPDSYSWNNVLSGDDTTESYTLHVNDGVSVT